MGALVGDKVKWDERFGDANYAIFCMSIDGVDFNIWEKPSERYNVDSSLCSFKSNHGAWRYLIALSVWESKCVYIYGPVKAGAVNDLALWRLDLKQRMSELVNKLAICDRGFQTSEPDEVHLLAPPSTADPEDLALFKTRARQRHETFNGRLKDFKILQDVFRFDADKHGSVVRAVVVRVQYQMESGSPLFEV